MKRAELISTGSELLSGRSVNTNVQLLGAALRSQGINLHRDTTVIDDIDEIRDAVATALERADLVFVCGGLGPTEDDVTRDALSVLLNRGVHRDPDAVEHINRACKRSGRLFTDIRASQATVLDGSVVLLNRVGAAPGMRLDLDDGKTLFVLPGPPGEFRAVLDDHILPWLQADSRWRAPYMEKLFMLCGVAEADAVGLMRENSLPSPGIDAAYCAAPGRLEVRLSSATGDIGAIDTDAERFRSVMGPLVYAETRCDLEEVVGHLLRDAGRTLAVAESCTGGGLGARITAVPGSSAYFIGGIIAYADSIKQEHLDIGHELIASEGVVSEKVAAGMADGIRRHMNTDYGIGITGIAGPTGQTAFKPVGTVCIALAENRKLTARTFQFHGDRRIVRFMAEQTALDMLRRRILSLEEL